MADDKGQTRGIRISDRTIIILAVIAALALLAAVLIVPRYSAAFTEYRAARTEYKAAQTTLESAEREGENLAEGIQEKEALAAEIKQLSEESFDLAAKLETDIQEGKSSKRICYITLDDGPYNRGKKWLELFSKYNIKATFFLTTANGNKLPDQADLTAASMYPEYLKYGHTIGNHTYSHNYSDGGIYSGAKAFMKDVNKQQEFTQEATGGYTPQMIRFPGGSGQAGESADAIKEALRGEMLGWVDWTVDSGDSWGADRATKEAIIKNVKDAAEDQKIMVLLCHEWSQTSIDAMPEIIEYLESKGYVFMPLFYDSVMVQK